MTLDLRGSTAALPVARTAVAMAGPGSGELTPCPDITEICP
jgi:hypothetical protein